MTRLSLTLLFVFASLVFTGCRTDYDIADVAPEEHLDSEEHAGHDHALGEPCEEIDNEHEHSVDEQVEDSHAGHQHSTGDRNHGTQWFFNQPWAAPFIWKKLFRDAVIFLALAAVIFLIGGQRRRR